MSIEVFAYLDSRAGDLLAQGHEMLTSIPNAYVKYPCTHESREPQKCRCKEYR